MAGLDKNQAVINYLMTCPTVKNNKLFFNFAEEEDNSNQIVVNGDDSRLSKPFVDGSVMKLYTFTMLMYKAVAFNPVVKKPTKVDQNVTDLSEVQDLIDWIVVQNSNLVFPNFGPSCIIESVETQTDKPILNGVDTSSNPPLAQYSVVIKITYLDKSNMIWS